ncbi:MAG: DUF3576 domain-containing protein [Pseudomonadota bacterium]
MKKTNLFNTLILSTLVLMTSACSSSNKSDDRNLGLATINFGDKGGQAATVNRYLWAASLETLDFLPVFSADPIAGLIITDWYANPESPQEQFKVTVYILDSALRADALRVAVFRQLQNPDGKWIDAATNPATGREIENAILTRARELRLNRFDD